MTLTETLSPFMSMEKVFFRPIGILLLVVTLGIYQPKAKRVLLSKFCFEAMIFQASSCVQNLNHVVGWLVAKGRMDEMTILQPSNLQSTWALFC